MNKMKETDVLPRVRDFFCGKSVLVTGASGFLGRTLLEKLLREAPDIDTIFVLLRPKKGCAPRDRLQPMTNVKLFQRLRQEQPLALAKLHAVAGDVQEPGLGLSPEDVALLREKVHVVYHVAASVRFDDPLRKAVLLNVRGTREVCELAKGMKNLQAVVHVSTAFCNSDKIVNEEKLSPPPADWRYYVDAAERLDNHILCILTRKLMGEHPNTYVFTKSLAEHVISDYRNELPVAILRPSVVMGSYHEPFPGWIDNTYGPLGVALGILAGAIHTNFMTTDQSLDCIPVDKVVNGLVILGMKCSFRGKGSLNIVNATSYTKRMWNGEDCTPYVRILNFDYPLDVLYKPFSISVKSINLFYIFFLLIDGLISIFYELLCHLQGRKKGMLFIHRSILASVYKFLPFIAKQYEFPNTKFKNMYKNVSPEDENVFDVIVDDLSIIPYHLSLAYQLKTYFIKPKKNFPMFKYITLEIIHYVICGLILWTIWKLKLPSIAFGILFRIGRFCLMV